MTKENNTEKMREGGVKYQHRVQHGSSSYKTCEPDINDELIEKFSVEVSTRGVENKDKEPKSVKLETSHLFSYADWDGVPYYVTSTVNMSPKKAKKVAEQIIERAEVVESLRSDDETEK